MPATTLRGQVRKHDLRLPECKSASHGWASEDA